MCVYYIIASLCHHATFVTVYVLFVLLGGGVVEVISEERPVLAMPYPAGTEVYCIRGALFDETYQLDDRRTHVPTQHEMLGNWMAVLQNKAGGLYRESDLVFRENVLGDDEKDSGGDEVEFSTHVVVWCADGVSEEDDQKTICI